MTDTTFGKLGEPATAITTKWQVYMGDTAGVLYLGMVNRINQHLTAISARWQDKSHHWNSLSLIAELPKLRWGWNLRCLTGGEKEAYAGYLPSNTAQGWMNCLVSDKECYQANKAAHLHLVMMPSTQTRLPRYRLVSVRGVTCLLPKLKHRCCSISHTFTVMLLTVHLSSLVN